MPLDDWISDQSAVEAALASLIPAEVQIDCDRLLFLAGAEAAGRSRRKLTRFLVATLALSVLVSIALGGALMTSPKPTIAEPAKAPNVQPVQNLELEALGPAAESMQVASRFSPILNVDGWSAERLGKAGITIQTWKHDLQGETPAWDWVEITFESAQVPKNQDVVMTVWLAGDGNTPRAAARAVRDKRQPDKVSILCSVRSECVANSNFDLFIWQPQPKGGSRAYGYRLSMKRVLEVAKAKAAVKSAAPAGR